MPITLNTTNESLINLPIMNAKLAKQAWWNTFWSKLAGFQEITRTNNIRQTMPADNVVVQGIRDFVEQGRDNMLMYMLLPLSGEGVYGDAWLKGTGEQLNLKYTQVFINQWRKAAAKMSGRMNNQRVKLLNLMEEVQPSLTTWWTKAFNAAFFQAIYEGVSPNLSAGTLNNGLGLVRRTHPNQYYHSADGTLTTLGTEKKTKVATNFNAGLGTSKSVYKASAKMLSELRIILSTVLLIEPIVHKGGEFWLFLVHPDVMKQLKADTAIINAQGSAFMGQLASHPALQGRDFLYYDGICVLEERLGVRTKTLANITTLDDYFNNLATNTYFLPPTRATSGVAFANIVLGRDALAYGVASDLEYTTEVDDHGNVIEIGSQCIMGVNRLEHYDDSVMSTVFARNKATVTDYATATEAVNQSSAIIYTGLS